MNLLRKLLFPFVPIYWIVTSLRNKLFDLNLLKSKSYNNPVICIGNLSVGGTGKSPMVEYLLRLFNNKRAATLSRGYKRKTRGFILADESTEVEDIGDEPFQFKQKFKDVIVAVDENRQRGIESLLSLPNSPDVILLDDAFQHRKVKAGFNILLTTYNRLYVDDCVLPTGNLREPKSGAKRANVVVVTKCPENLSEKEKQKIANKLKLKDDQKLFFSRILYDDYAVSNQGKILIDDLKDTSFTLVTGIANPTPLVDYLKQKQLRFEHLNFKDHHNFTKDDFKLFKEKELILTTEKDFVRLKYGLKHAKAYFIPITVGIDNEEAFRSLIGNFVG